MEILTAKQLLEAVDMLCQTLLILNWSGMAETSFMKWSPVFSFYDSYNLPNLTVRISQQQSLDLRSGTSDKQAFLLC